MISILLIVATVAIMIFFNALYVAAEFSTVSARKTRINQLAGEGNRTAQALLPIMEDAALLDRYVAACQLGITVSSLVVGAYGQNVIATQLVAPINNLLQQLAPLLSSWGIEIETAVNSAAQSLSIIIVLVFITVLQVVIGELLPKSVAVQYPEEVALRVTQAMKLSLWLFTYPIQFFNGSGRLILRLIGRPAKEKKAIHSPQEIELLVTESHEVGLLEDNERQLLRNAFRLRELTARQVMHHRTRVVAAHIDSSIIDLMKMAIEAGFSRIPLYQESIDNIIGFVHIKELFRLYVQGEENITSIIREVVYVPETLPAAEVWKILNSKRKYLAIVFDEYGGTAGLVTFEDLIEEIFGELQDEFDDESALIARDKEGRVYLRGDLLVTDVNEYLELDLPTEADTLSGLIFSQLGRAPNVDDKVTVGTTVIQVEAMADLGVSEVSLHLSRPETVAPFGEWEVAEHE